MKPGAKHTEEAIAKMRLAHKGHVPFVHTEQSKRKLREANLGTKKSPEAREKMRRAAIGRPGYWKGKKRGEEFARRMSEKKRVYSKLSEIAVNRQRWHFQNWLKGKPNGFEKYVGIPLDAFKAYIQCKFLPWMNWNNRGVNTWHIDHEFPLSGFDISKEEESLRAWHYRNLQPMAARDNLSKAAKRNPTQTHLAL
jgi:hypothetical protein